MLVATPRKAPAHGRPVPGLPGGPARGAPDAPGTGRLLADLADRAGPGGPRGRGPAAPGPEAPGALRAGGVARTRRSGRLHSRPPRAPPPVLRWRHDQPHDRPGM